jgi:hypothetical protein
MNSYQPQLIAGLQRFIKGPTKLEVNGPWLLSLSLLNAKHCQIIVDERWYFITMAGKPSDLDDLKSETVEIPADLNFENLESVALAIKQPLRETWRPCDHRTFPMYRENGAIEWIEN